MVTLYWLDQIQTEDHLRVGEQALHLSLLANKGYPVLPSLVISAEQFREFLRTIHWLEPFFSDLPSSSLRLNIEDPQQLQVIARQIRQTIQHAPLPDRWILELDAAVKTFPSLTTQSKEQAVILRPSLTCKSLDPNSAVPTLSTEMLSLIEPQVCWCEMNSLAAGLKQLWAELFRARNLVYWQRSKISLEQLHLAVLVQPIADAIAAGSLQASSRGWEVLAIAGLEMAIARGEVLPDFYRITPQNAVIHSQKRGNQTVVYRIKQSNSPLASPLHQVLSNDHPSGEPVLEAKHLQRFVQLTQQLTADFKVPLDLEWQLYGTDTSEPQLYLTQVSYQDASSSPYPELGASEEVLPLAAPNFETVNSLSAIVTGLGATAGRTIATAQVITNIQTAPTNLPPRTVLVMPTLMPDGLALLKQSIAVVTEQGGMTSHGAIVARELGIPAVIGAPQATERIRTGDLLLVDGSTGKVYQLNQTEQENRKMQDEEIQNVRQVPTSAPIDVPPFVGEGRVANATQLMVNLSQPDLIDRAANLPTIDGVGILRSELMLLTVLDQQHPQKWLQEGRQQPLTERLTEQIQRFAAEFLPRPVFYRTSDLRSHEFQSLQGAEAVSPETNPMLGMRGTFRYLVNSDLFEVELAALRQVISSGYSNLRLVLPFVRTVEEFTFCHSRIEQAGLTQYPQFQLWIMAEVPSVLFLLPEYVRAGVQGICIGTSDLTQLLLGVDRDRSLMAAAFNEHHPAVLSAIGQLIQTARQLGIPCSISTQAALEPGFIDRLVEWGITSISVNLDAVESAYRAIARAEQRWLMKRLRNQ